MVGLAFESSQWIFRLRYQLLTLSPIFLPGKSRDGCCPFGRATFPSARMIFRNPRRLDSFERDASAVDPGTVGSEGATGGTFGAVTPGAGAW